MLKKYNRRQKRLIIYFLICMFIFLITFSNLYYNKRTTTKGNTTLWKYQYTKTEVQMLGDLIWIEAKEYINNADYEYICKLIGSVALHRMVSNQFPNTMYEVIHQGEGTENQQYTSVYAIGNIDTPDFVYEWAEEILRDGPIGPENLVSVYVENGQICGNYL